MEQPSIISFYDYSSEERQALGISDELVRLAVGIEDATDLIDDLERGIQAL